MMMFEKLNILTVLMIFNTLGVYATTTVIKVRFEAEGSLQCDSVSGSYNWTRDDVAITRETSGIDSDTVHSRTLDITSMNQLLVGMYECRLNGQLRNTFDVRIVGLARYKICQNDPDDCSENITYGSTSTKTFILNATITFVKSGTDCCQENLLDPVWEVIMPPGNTNNGREIRNNGVYPPGIYITIEASNDLITNIANVTIRNASVPFQITHLMHTNVDDNEAGGGQISITFNFNYTEGTAATTMTSSVDLPTPSTTPMIASMPPVMTSSSTSQTSTTTSTPDSSFTTTKSPSPTPSNTSVVPSPSAEDTMGMDEDDNGNSGVIIGVVVSLVVIIIVVVAIIVAVFFWRHRKKQGKHPPTPGGQSGTAHSNSANGSAPRPTTLNYSNAPLLDHTGSNAYTCTTTTPHTVDGAPNPYGNTSNDDVHHQDADDPDDQPVDDSCFDAETNDSSSVEVQIF